MKITFALMVAVLLAQLPARGMTKSQNTFKPSVYGAGSLTCENWTVIRDAESPAMHYVQLSWVEGFVTALHNYTQNLKVMDRASIDPWISEYCQRHPGDMIVHAAASLTKELVDSERR